MKKNRIIRVVCAIFIFCIISFFHVPPGERYLQKQILSYVLEYEIIPHLVRLYYIIKDKLATWFH